MDMKAIYASRIPFYPNTPDDTHCYQAALKMVLKYFLPDKEYSWDKLEKLTAKVEGLWTWPTQGLINLHKMGFNVVDIEDFDIYEFIKEGDKYLIKKYGEEVGSAQIKHGDIEQEKRIYKEYLQLNLHQQRLPDIDDIEKLLEGGYLVICNVNSHLLNDETGYAGHFAVIYDYDGKCFFLHDPGLPPLEARKVTYEDFTKAWEYPDKTAKNIQAFKLAKNRYS